MREPTVHITMTHLKLVMKQALHLDLDKGALDAVLTAARKYQIRDRNIVYAKSKNQKKMEKGALMSEMNVEEFNRLLVSKRVSMGHKFVQAIKKADRDYPMLVEASNYAIEFAEMFHVEPFEGMRMFIEIGLGLMGPKYGVNKFKYFKTKIHEIAESAVIINSDENKGGTEALFNIWIETLTLKAGVKQGHRRGEIQYYVNMVYARRDADEMEADYKDWIEAQFAELAWMNVVPEVGQLFGDNAKNRYEKYVIKNKVTKNADRKENTSLTEASDESEEAYWQEVKNRAKKK